VLTSRSVFLHIGLPKTGTPYLQRVLHANRPALQEQGILYPGKGRDHLLPAHDLLQQPLRGHQGERAAGTWRELLREVADWPGAALISHETFMVARADQVQTIVAAFPDRPVEVIVTARDLARQLTAYWQESVKNGRSPGLSEYVARVRARDGDEPRSGFWLWQDLVAVLRRWQPTVPADRIHLVTVPPRGTGAEVLWHRFAEVLAVSLTADQIADRPARASLGMAETEFLRRLNADLGDTVERSAYRTYVTQFLSQRVLPRSQQPDDIALSPDDQVWAADRSREVVRTLETIPLQLHGDLTDLESSVVTADGVQVSDSDLVRVGVRAISKMLLRIASEQDTPTVRGRTS
jgi:hypothetical protein